jgi:hypothetical protein
VKRSIAPIIAATLMCSAATLGAQVVGYPPPRSPFVDLEHAQELTFIVGQYHAHRDPADVGPQSGL